jgi:hypothetical protein
MKLLKVGLFMVEAVVFVIAWVVLLDTSYDWISAPSDIKVLLGCVILVSMIGAAIALLAKGARFLWKR